MQEIWSIKKKNINSIQWSYYKVNAGNCDENIADYYLDAYHTVYR